MCPRCGSFGIPCAHGSHYSIPKGLKARLHLPQAGRCQLEGHCWKIRPGDEACRGLEPPSHTLPHQTPPLDLLITGHGMLAVAQGNQAPGRPYPIFWCPRPCPFASPCMDSYHCEESIWPFKVFSFDNPFSKGIFIVSRDWG